MSTVLNLGILDVPYAEGKNSTGDVAEILEKTYSIMALFSLLHGADIIEGLENVMQDRLENLLMGDPGAGDDLAQIGPWPNRLLSSLFPEGSLSSIEETFRKMLDNRELDGHGPGIPTQASLLGHNPRLLHPYAKGNPSRPSFIATGAYQNSMRVWIAED
jgi:hypothetical protein